MLSTLRNAWKVPDLRKRLLWTLLIVAIYRIGNHIPVPGIDPSKLKSVAESSGGLINFYDLISGGALSKASIFTLGVAPYINASIIMQLLTIAIPQLEQLSKEGDDGRKKIQKITRYAAIGLACVMSWGSYALIKTSTGAITNNSMVTMGVIMLTLVVGATFAMWLGDRITVKGIGNGVSMIIFANIISRYPSQFAQIYQLKSLGEVSGLDITLLLLFLLAMLCGIIFLSLSERRIHVQYAGKAVGNKVYKGQSSHIPLSIIGTTVIAIIFAMSVMQTPGTIARFFPQKSWAQWMLSGTNSPFNSKEWIYPIIYAILTVFFTWFYTQVTFKPDEMAENMHKSAGFIPGIRPGQPTAKYLERVLDRISVFGGVFAAIIAVTPVLIESLTNFKNIQFGGTSLLILVSVALEVMRQLESQLVMRHYQGFLK